MPTVITVPPDAAFEGVRQHLARFTGTHVLLEAPHQWRELDSIAHLRLLQRQAQHQRCELGIVCTQSSVCKTARDVGIPTFASRKDASGDRWRMHPIYPVIDPRHPDAVLPDAPQWRGRDIVATAAMPRAHRKRQKRIADGVSHRKPMPWWLRLLVYSLMAALMVALLTAFAFNILPAATITITPGREQLNVTIPIIANPDIEISDIEAGVVPGRLVEMTLENIGALVTTGTQQKPVDKATGSVVFSNLGNAPVDIPKGSVVSTGTGTPVNFRTTEDAKLDGGVGVGVTVPVEAEEPGISGNVRANTINTVNGALRFRVRVSNPNGTGGGGSQLVSVVTQQDKDNLLAQLQSEASAQAYESLLAELEPDEWMPRESVQVYTIAQAFDKFNDDEGDTVQLTLRSLVQGTAMRQEDAQDVLLAALRANAAKDAMLVSESIGYGSVTDVSAIGRQVAFTMTGMADYVVPIDPVELKDMVSGLTAEEARAAITARWPIETTPDIYLDPEWLPTLPRLSNRIQVRIEYAGDQASQ